MPQGSVLGPDLFTDYSSPICEITRSHGVSVHCYADDTQLYASFIPGETESSVLSKLQRCISDLRTWMNANRLKLNDSKTEFIIFGSSPNLKKVKTNTISIGQEHITALSSAHNICAYMDKHLEMKVHISNICKAAWHNLHKIEKIRSYLTQDQTEAVVHVCHIKVRL